MRHEVANYIISTFWVSHANLCLFREDVGARQCFRPGLYELAEIRRNGKIR